MRLRHHACGRNCLGNRLRKRKDLAPRIHIRRQYRGQPSWLVFCRHGIQTHRIDDQRHRLRCCVKSRMYLRRKKSSSKPSRKSSVASGTTSIAATKATRASASRARTNGLARNTANRLWHCAHVPADPRRSGQHFVDPRTRHIQPSGVRLTCLPASNGSTRNTPGRLPRRARERSRYDNPRSDDRRQVHQNRRKVGLHAQTYGQGTALGSLAHSFGRWDDNRVPDPTLTTGPLCTVRTKHLCEQA